MIVLHNNRRFENGKALHRWSGIIIALPLSGRDCMQLTVSMLSAKVSRSMVMPPFGG